MPLFPTERSSRESSETRGGHAEPTRGVSPRILLDQIRNTVPFLLSSALPGTGPNGHFPSAPPYQAVLRRTALHLELAPERSLSHADYFELCVSAHFASVASFVPTDVDNQIRFRLWAPALDTGVVLEMAGTVSAMSRWDPRPVSARWVVSESGRVLSGHSGEWFSTAVAAYAALRKRLPEAAGEMLEKILEEIRFEAALFCELRDRSDGIGLLRASALIAHNLGDLDRVVEMWNLPDLDPLRRLAYKVGHAQDGRFDGALFDAGRLNKAFLADENHRHFALRGPKCLRRGADLLLPVGPFFDDWGRGVARHPGLSEDEVAEVAEALVDGWVWLREKKDGPGKVTSGYARAIAGIIEGFPGGAGRLLRALPARIAKAIRAGELGSLISVPRRRFEEQWNRKPFNLLRKLRTTKSS